MICQSSKILQNRLEWTQSHATSVECVTKIIISVYSIYALILLHFETAALQIYR